MRLKKVLAVTPSTLVLNSRPIEIEVQNAYKYLDRIQDLLVKTVKTEWISEIVNLSLLKDSLPHIKFLLRDIQPLSKLNDQVYDGLVPLKPALPFTTSNLLINQLIGIIKEVLDHAMERMMSIAIDKDKTTYYIALSAKSSEDIPKRNEDMKKIEAIISNKYEGLPIIFCETNERPIPFYRKDKEANGRFCSEMSILNHIPIENVDVMVTAWVGVQDKARYLMAPTESPSPKSPQRYIKSVKSGSSTALSASSHCPGCARNMLKMWYELIGVEPHTL